MSIDTGVFKYGIRILIDIDEYLFKTKAAVVELCQVIGDSYATYSSIEKPHCLVVIKAEDIGYLPFALFELYELVRDNDGKLLLVGYPEGSSDKFDIIIASNEDIELFDSERAALRSLNPYAVSQSTLDELKAFEDQKRQEYLEEKEQEEKDKITCYAMNCPCRSSTQERI